MDRSTAESAGEDAKYTVERTKILPDVNLKWDILNGPSEITHPILSIENHLITKQRPHALEAVRPASNNPSAIFSPRNSIIVSPHRQIFSSFARMASNISQSENKLSASTDGMYSLFSGPARTSLSSLQLSPFSATSPPPLPRQLIRRSSVPSLSSSQSSNGSLAEDLLIIKTFIDNPLSNGAYKHRSISITGLSPNSPIACFPSTGACFVARPSVGRNGRSISVRANFFEIFIRENQLIYSYDIRILPETTVEVNRKVVDTLLKNESGSKQNKLVVFDGRKYLYSPCALEDIDNEGIEYDVIIFDDHTRTSTVLKLGKSSEAAGVNCVGKDEASIRELIRLNCWARSGEKKFFVRIKPLSTIRIKSLLDQSSSAVDVAPLFALSPVDTILRHKPSALFTPLGRSFFSPSNSKALGDGAECWLGFHQSIHPSKGKLLANIDMTATSLFESGPILNTICRLAGKKELSDLQGPLKLRDIEKCERFVRGIKIQITHRGNVRRKHRVLGITRTPADQTFFTLANKTGVATPSDKLVNGVTVSDVSVASYFLTQYNIQLNFPHLPCLIAGPNDRQVFLPFEFCEILPGQRFLRKLNEQQTAQIIRITCQAPGDRAAKIVNAAKNLGFGSAWPGSEEENSTSSAPDCASQFGLSISDKMMTIPARIIHPPTIQYSVDSMEPTVVPRDGSWNLRAKRVLQPATLQYWSVICFCSQRDVPQSQIDQFICEMITVCRDTGLLITNLRPPIIYGSAIKNVEKTLESALMAPMCTNSPPHLATPLSSSIVAQTQAQLIFCILPNTSVPLYAKIKRVCDTQLGVATQCIQFKHIHQPKKQYCANVCLKINVKLGGANSHIVPNPSLPGDTGLSWISNEPSIIFGANVTHPTHGEAKSTGTVCSLVASFDKIASRYASTVRIQLARQESIIGLTEMMLELLKIYMDANRTALPRRFLFYRNGVRDKQANRVAKLELILIRDACAQIHADFKPKITYIIVQKRHHTRVFPINSHDADRSGNVLAGTVIDSHITRPNEFDFYLCSHAGLQGTSRPTHYHVLHDENHFSSDELQELTYRLCFTYARCTRSVSVVPPAYYADLVSFRAKNHLKSAMARGEPLLADDNATPTSNYQDSFFTGDVASPYSRFNEVPFKSRMRDPSKNGLVPVKEQLQKVMYFM